MYLTDIEVALVVTRVLSGDSWTEVARDMTVTPHRLRRCVADKLNLHIPKKRKR
jgi:hypothetical protein